MTTYKTLNLETQNQITRVTVNRPEALNAINQNVLEDLLAVFSDLFTQNEVRGVIITGAGEKAFVAGADISQMNDMTALQADEFCRLGHACMNAIQNFKYPVIAAVNGFALGGGLELALACDFIYASNHAKLGLPEVNLGLFPGFGGTQRLARVVGVNRAKEMIFTADMLSAEEAFRIGLVNKVVDVGAHGVRPQEAGVCHTPLLEAAEETLRKIASKGPVAVRLAKRVLNEGSDLSLAAGLELEASQFPLTFATEDRKIGVEAFLNKKKAEFVGR